MADRNWKDPEDTPQFNYRVPGEPETYAPESKELPDGEKRAKAVKSRVEKQQDHLDRQNELNRDPDSGLSPNRGMSDPKTQKQIDDMNTWSPGR